MTTPSAAAAVILYRESPNLEVFWVRRMLQMSYQGGFYAFPGGRLEPHESPRDAAVRELHEETGVQIDPDELRDAGRWVTPPITRQRFDTQFFLARCPPDQTARVLSSEHDVGEWIRPQDAIRKWREGSILIAPPIKHALNSLSEGLSGVEARLKSAPDARSAGGTEIEMRRGVAFVPLRTPTLPPATHTNCYLIGDDDVVVIDPASPYEEEQALLDRVLEKRRARIREIWLTHLHRDHVGGANHLRQRWGAKIAAHPITARDLAGQVHVDRTFAPNETLDLEGQPGWRLRILHTPGHARGHVCIFEELHGSLITGDLIAGFGTIIIDPPEGRMADYLDSLRRVLALEPTALFPAHGPVIGDAAGRIREYIKHRLEREENILMAWRRGVRDAAAIVAAVYTDVDPAMHGFAERSVTAHLEKLRDEGRL